MRFLRWFIAALVLFFDRTFPAKPEVVRTAAEQARIDAITATLSLYQYLACPFCLKVRRAAQRLAIQLPVRDARGQSAYGRELEQQGGYLQVPCLRIPKADGSVQWLYESDDIIAYLKNI